MQQGLRDKNEKCQWPAPFGLIPQPQIGSQGGGSPVLLVSPAHSRPPIMPSWGTEVMAQMARAPTLLIRILGLLEYMFLHLLYTLRTISRDLKEIFKQFSPVIIVLLRSLQSTSHCHSRNSKNLMLRKMLMPLKFQIFTKVMGEDANKGSHREANYIGNLWKIAEIHFILRFYMWSHFISTTLLFRKPRGNIRPDCYNNINQNLCGT